MTTERAGLAGTKPIRASFEFFPPKTEAMETKLWSSVERLGPLNPEFVSVTYGAGGTTRARTHETVKRIQNEMGLQAAAHLTCVGATREQVDEVIRAYWRAGIRHIVALRGDPPEGVGAAYQPFPGGYVNAADLAAGIRRIGDFEISVGAYPEKHPESASFDADLELLKAKVDAGATRAITQFAFDSEVIMRFRDKVRASGIDIPIVPGVMPVTNFTSLRRFAAGCGASIPDWLAHLFEKLEDDPATRNSVAISVAAMQCATLRNEGFDQFHFYTLNRADMTYAICHLLGMRPTAVLES